MRHFFHFSNHSLSDLFKYLYLDTIFCILCLYLDTIFGEYLKKYLYLDTFWKYLEQVRINFLISPIPILSRALNVFLASRFIPGTLQYIAAWLFLLVVCLTDWSLFIVQYLFLHRVFSTLATDYLPFAGTKISVIEYDHCQNTCHILPTIHTKIHIGTFYPWSVRLLKLRKQSHTTYLAIAKNLTYSAKYHLTLAK